MGPSHQRRRAALAAAAGFEDWRQALEQTAHLGLDAAAARLGISRSVLWNDRRAYQITSRRVVVPFDPDDPSDTRHSAYGYRTLGCRCPTCTSDHARVHQQWKLQAKSYPKAWTHGISGYFNYDCRCPECVQARRDYRARRDQIQ